MVPHSKFIINFTNLRSLSKPLLVPLKAENITKSLYKSGIDSMDHTSRHSTTGRVEK